MNQKSNPNQKTFSGLGDFWGAMTDGNDYLYSSGGGDLQVRTVLDDKFKIPSEFQNQYIYDESHSHSDKYSIIVISEKENKWKLMAKGIDFELATELSMQANNELSSTGLQFIALKDSLVKMRVEGMDRFQLSELDYKYFLDPNLPEYKDERVNTLVKIDPRFEDVLIKKSFSIKPLGIKIIDNSENISNGKYLGYQYGYIIELSDGRKLRTETGVRCSKKYCGGLKEIEIHDGYVQVKNNKNFSGMAEAQGALDGVDYGAKPESSWDMSKVTLDPSFQPKDNKIIKNMKTFSLKSKPSVKVTDKDLQEFNWWIKGKKINPRLRKKFDSDLEYEEFIMDYQDKNFSRLVKVFGECPEDGCIQQKPNGKWGVISNKTGEFWEPDYSSEEKAKAALSAYHAQKGFSNNDETPIDQDKSVMNNQNPTQATQRMYSGILDKNEDTSNYGKGNLIGTLTSSHSYIHLFHYVTNSYAQHIALEQFYDEISEKTDSLAEKILANQDIDAFDNEVFPKSCPIDYLARLKEYILNNFGSWVTTIEPEAVSAYQSLIDDIVNLIDQTLYRLRRLDSGNAIFSVKGSKNFAYGDDHGIVTVKTSNPDQLAALLEKIKSAGNVGHSFEIVVDPDNSDYRESFDWDGDGSDSISEVKVEKVKSESKRFSDFENFPELKIIIEKYPEIDFTAVPSGDNYEVTVTIKTQSGDVEQIAKTDKAISKPDVIDFVRQVAELNYDKYYSK